MTVKELKEILKNMDDNLEVIIEVTERDAYDDDIVFYERNETVDHFEFNDKEFYLVG